MAYVVPNSSKIRSNQHQQINGKSKTIDIKALVMQKQRQIQISLAASSAALSPDETTTALTKKLELKKRIKQEGGPLAFQTPLGALNPFGIYWGLVSIGLGLFWFAGMELCRLFYLLTFNMIDKNRRIPVTISHIWGVLLLRLSRSYPEIENRQVLREMYKKHKGAMFVANHSSWNDIPFLGVTIGWHNYKFVAKKELLKVPILSEAMRVGGNVIVDRSDRKSQLLTLKSGIQKLKDGISLCTFPEGTRSKTGRLVPFKNGAFKMAHKAGAPVVPLSIVHANIVMPSHWVFPLRPSKGVCKVIIHEPIDSVGKTEEELADAVRQAIISGLPEDQRPLEKA